MQHLSLSGKIGYLYLIAIVGWSLSSCRRTIPVAPPPVTGRWTHLAAPVDTITVLERFDTAIFAASNSNTLYSSTDHGAHWTSVQVGTQDETITAIKVFNDRIYVGTDNNRIFVSNDRGSTWGHVSDLSIPSIEGSVAITSFSERNGVLYASSQGNGVYVLSNEPNTWKTFDNNLPLIITSYFVYGGLLNSQDTLLAAAGSNSSFYRYDFTSSQWVSSSLPLPLTHIISMIADGGVVFGLTDEQYILRSSDKGATWQEDDLDHKRWTPASPFSTPFLYSGTTRDYAVTNLPTGGVWGAWVQERNIGAVIGTTWTQRQSVVEGQRAHALVEEGGMLFLGTDGGIYTRTIDQ